MTPQARRIQTDERQKCHGTADRASRLLVFLPALTYSRRCFSPHFNSNFSSIAAANCVELNPNLTYIATSGVSGRKSLHHVNQITVAFSLAASAQATII